MKKYVFAAIAAVASAGLTACHNDESGTETKPFECSVLYNLRPMQTDGYKGGSIGAKDYLAALESENKTIAKALNAMAGEERKLIIMATDSADMAKQANMKTTEALGGITDTGWVGRHEVRVTWDKEDHYTPDVVKHVLGNKEGTPIDQHGEKEGKDSDNYNPDEYNMIRQGSIHKHIPNGYFMDQVTLDDQDASNFDTNRHPDSYVSDEDLNNWAGGKYIHLRTNSLHKDTGVYTDFICIRNEGGFIADGTKIVWEGRTYEKVPGGGRKKNETVISPTSLNGDCNQGAGGNWLFLFATKDTQNLKYGADKWVKDIGVIAIGSRTMKDYNDGYDYLTRRFPQYYNQKKVEAGEIRYVPMIDLHKDGTLTKYNEVADFNNGAKGDWIYMIMHLKGKE